MIVIVDVDHTISDARWRDHLVGDWPAYYPAGEHDPPILPMIKMVNCMSITGCRVIHLTGRPEKWRALTLSWMVKNKVYSSGLLMRPEGDFRQQKVIKLALVREHFDLKDIGLVIDDREDVLNEFRAAGVHTLQAGLGGPVVHPEGMR